MSDAEVIYIYVRQKRGGGWVYEARDSEHNAVKTSEGFDTAQKAAQAGADAYPSAPDAGVEVRVQPVDAEE